MSFRTKTTVYLGVIILFFIFATTVSSKALPSRKTSLTMVRILAAAAAT